MNATQRGMWAHPWWHRIHGHRVGKGLFDGQHVTVCRRCYCFWGYENGWTA